MIYSLYLRHSYVKLHIYDTSEPVELSRYGDGLRAEVQFPAEANDFSLLHNVQSASGAHPASYPMGRVGKAAGA
jgi:hypothetical protein